MAERALRKRLEHGSFYVGGIQGDLDPRNRADRRYIEQLENLLGATDTIVKHLDPVVAKPVFDRTTLVLAIKDAAEKFHTAWRARLGFEFRAGVNKEHWSRVKALSRRLAEGWAEGYDTLQPIADLHRELKEKIYMFIQSPLEWTGSPTEDEKQTVLEGFANGVSARILAIASRRLRVEHVPDWQKAYSKSGVGSTFGRAAIIEGDIYEKAAPVPDIAASLDSA